MSENVPLTEPTAAPEAEAANLLEGLEALREELGSIADDIILLLRDAGVKPPVH